MQVNLNYILIIFLVLIIILCIYYFFYNINKEKKTLEKFNSGKNFLSKYSKENFNNRSNEKLDIDNSVNNWEGIWVSKYKNRYIYSYFERLHNKLLISLSYTYQNIFNNNEDSGCGKNNIYIMRASLNFKNNIFYRTDNIFCNSFANDIIIPAYGERKKVILYGKIINNDTIIMYNYNTGGPRNIEFKRYETIENFENNLNYNINNNNNNINKNFWYPQFLFENGFMINDLYFFYYYLTCKYPGKKLTFLDFKKNLQNYLDLDNSIKNNLLSTLAVVPDSSSGSGFILNKKCVNIPDEPEISCTKSWTDPDPLANGRTFTCDTKTGQYNTAEGGYCPKGFDKIGNLCIHPTANNFTRISKDILFDNTSIREVIMYFSIGQLPLDFKITNLGWNENLLYQYANSYPTVNDFLNPLNMKKFTRDNSLKSELPINGFLFSTEIRHIQKIMQYYLRPNIVLPWNTKYLSKYKWFDQDLENYKKFLINTLSIQNPTYDDFADFTNILAFTYNNTSVTTEQKSIKTNYPILKIERFNNKNIENFADKNNEKFPLPNYSTVFKIRDINSIDNIISYFLTNDIDIRVNYRFWRSTLLRDYGWSVKILCEYHSFIKNKNVESYKLALTYADFKSNIQSFIQFKKQSNVTLLEDKFFYFDNIIDNDTSFKDVYYYYSIGQLPFNFDISKFKWNKDLLESYAKFCNNDVMQLLNINNMTTFCKNNNILELPISGFIFYSTQTVRELINYYLDTSDLPLWNSSYLSLYGWSSSELNLYRSFELSVKNSEILDNYKADISIQNVLNKNAMNAEYDFFTHFRTMGQYIINSWNNSKKYPLPNYKTTMYNLNVKNADEIINFYENSESNELTNSIRNNLYFANHPNVNYCGYMSNFYKYNSCIICYVTDLKDVKTLNYEFFGSSKSESYLTLQKDKFTNFCESEKGILDYYKNDILKCKSNLLAGIDLVNMRNNFSIDKLIEILTKDVFPYLQCLFNELKDPAEGTNFNNNILNALSFTNLIEYKNELGFANYISNIINVSSVEAIYYRDASMINDTKNKTIKKKMPMIWTLKGNSNVNDFCNFTIESSALENKVIKYPEFNDNGTTNLSLFNDGAKKILCLEHQRLIYESPNLDSNKTPLYTAITGNIRSSNELFLVNGNENVGLESDITSVKLKPLPNENSKWFIIGFNLKDKNELNKIFNFKLF